MALLERINSMKQQNIPDSQIINTLKEEGVSPREINEALSQSKIKSAISINSPANTNSEMQQSIMPTQDQQMMAIPEQNYNHQMYSAEMQSQTYSQQAQAYPQQAQTADYSQQEYYQDQYTQPYDQTQQAYYPQGMDVETVRDISKQEIDEALKKIK
jgi:DNA-binding transcriptional MerR regulator